MAGHPGRRVARERRERFLVLCAQGVDPVAAWRASGVAAEVALRLVADRDEFDRVLAAIRQTTFRPVSAAA